MTDGETAHVLYLDPRLVEALIALKNQDEFRLKNEILAEIKALIEKNNAALQIEIMNIVTEFFVAD